ncbi:putative gpi-anchored cell surface glycoprotein [Erysiphe necator]|uniref:Putative gpi-anchored cell surface glycoprotein n=1 Tax=Uncinula necator TaxID=52586 RepID=A0A0B1P1W9_UNCNE|nr:putative gpi-anchored cell surface glycoprotein [Erysiphe necator]
MRTRATGHSPGGFHVLASPKRVRRQPPAPVRAPPTSTTTLERSKEQQIQACDENASASLKTRSHSNGKDADHISNLHQDISPAYLSESELQTNKSNSKDSSLRSIDSSNSARHNQIQQAKIKTVNTRDGLHKKNKSSRGISKRASKRDDYAVKDIVTVEVDSNKCSRDILPGPIQSVLGKRCRGTSSGSLTTSGFSNEVINYKRIRSNVKELNRSGLLSVQNLSSKNSLQSFDESIEENRSLNLKSGQLESIEGRTDSKISPKSLVLYRASPHNSILKFSSGNLCTEQKNDVESQLKQGMQSIMSRMNKYQYQPLPKNPYDSMAACSSTPQEHKNQGINTTRKSSISVSEADKNGFNSRTESHLLGSSSEYEKTLAEYSHGGQKRNRNDEDQLPERQRLKVDNLDKLKDRRIEVEKLFRTTAPNASYQNILRAVAEWAVHNSSTLPTEDEIFTYVESSKAPDATELFSSSDRLFPRRNHSKIRRVSRERSASLSTVRTKIPKNKNSTQNSQRYGSIPKNSCNDDGTATRRVTFKKSIENHLVESDSSKTPNEHSKPSLNIETPSTTNAQQTKSIASQSWGLVNSFKNLVSTPFKALGFGLGSNTQESLKNVTKDINFEYKPPATPVSSSRSVNSERRATKNRNSYRTPVRTPIRTTGKQSSQGINQAPTDKISSRDVVTEKRMAELQRELDLKKSERRERDSRNDTNRRRKKPTKHFEVTADYKSEVSNGAKLRQLNDQTTKTEDLFEEWPPNLDPNRQAVELAQASQFLPRGPNGEDVTTMLCSGWLISKYRDSFIREVGRRKFTPAPMRKTIFGTSAVSISTRTQNLDNCDLSNTTESKVGDTKIPNNHNQPGRSYGFQYDDDSSSDEDTTVDKHELSQSDSKGSNVEISNVTPRISMGFEKTNSLNESSNQSKSAQAADTTVRRLPTTPSTPYTPRMPSTLRNVEALSPYSSKLSTPSSEQNNTVSPSHNSEDMSLVLYEHNNNLTEYSDSCEDWSYIFDLDPQMMALDQKIIDAVEILPNDSLPCVELPAVIEELS